MTTPIDEAALVDAIERLRRALELVDGTLDQARGSSARGETQLVAVSDAARGLPGRGREVRASLQLLYESLERAKLSSLNAGLEAARLGDPAGKIVLELSGDLRELVTGALEALEAHANVLGESERERERWLDGVAQAREMVGAVGAQLGALTQQRQELGAALGVLERAVAPVLGADPKTVRRLLELGERSKALAQSLTELAREPGGPNDERLRQALSPLLEALGKVAGKSS
jgi:hypothetical protein